MSTFRDKEPNFDFSRATFNERATSIAYNSEKRFLESIQRRTHTRRLMYLPFALAMLLALYGTRAKPDAQGIKPEDNLKPITPTALVVGELPEPRPTIVPQPRVIPTPIGIALPKDTRQPITPESRITPSSARISPKPETGIVGPNQKSPQASPRQIVTHYPELGSSLIGLAQAEAGKELARRDEGGLASELKLEEEKAKAEGRKPKQPNPNDRRLQEYVAGFQSNSDGSNRVYLDFINTAKRLNKDLVGPDGDTIAVTEFKATEIGPIIDDSYLPRLVAQAILSRKNIKSGASDLYSEGLFTIPCPLDSTGFNIRPAKKRQPQGFGYSGTSGGLLPGRRDAGRLYITTNRQNGEYTREDIVDCRDGQGRYIPRAVIELKILLGD